MTAVRTKYVCQSCAYESPRWVGRCPNCNAWNSFVEEYREKHAVRKAAGKSAVKALTLEEVGAIDDQRTSTSVEEFDRVLGGGIVSGSVMLIGGDPGVGKSTLMMQLAGALRESVILYISGEESAKQIKLRAERLDLGNLNQLLVLTETDLDLVGEVVGRSEPNLIIVDSIQTMVRPELESSAGSVGQVRESTAFFIRLAKSRSIPVFLIGHVTKDGSIAGPKVIEHMVDTVLQFEGDRHYAYRILRAIKNRFGSTNEIGIFEMGDSGLKEVRNPSEVFLSERTHGTSGSTVVASIEGTRPLLLEVQALVTSTSYGVPQRNTTGIDIRRLSLLLAVLEKRLGVPLGQNDVFVNIAGGVRVEEPAVDLAVAVSIISSLREVAVAQQAIAIGEIGLGGEVRSVSQIEKRVQEAVKLGFNQIILPRNNLKTLTRLPEGGTTELVGVERVEEAIEVLLGNK